MEWRKIDGKPNYSVSNNGDVRNDRKNGGSGRVLKPHFGTSGYYQIMLGRKTSPLYVHRLVAIAFLPNPDNLPEVDHINGDKTDNRVSNLRWVTRATNRMAFGYEKPNIAKHKKVVAIKDGECRIFESRKAAASAFGFDTTHLVYGKPITRGNCDGWVFYKAKDMV